MHLVPDQLPNSEIRFRGSGSAPKCHGSPTLVQRYLYDPGLMETVRKNVALDFELEDSIPYLKLLNPQHCREESDLNWDASMAAIKRTEQLVPSQKPSHDQLLKIRYRYADGSTQYLYLLSIADIP